MRRLVALVAAFVLAGSLAGAASAAPHGSKGDMLRASSVSTFRAKLDLDGF